MIEFGKTLREAREAKGLTINQVAERTHMMTQMVENLENENFSKIAAPIYGRGFVKLYCEELGLDPKPLIAEFMDIYNGNREPTIKMRAVPPEPVSAPEPALAEPQAQEPSPAPEPPQAPEPPAAGEPAFTLEQESVGAGATPPQDDAETGELFAHAESAAIERQGHSRYAAPMPIDDGDDRHLSIPPAVWRILALAVAASLVLWLLLVGVKALYHATMDAPAKDPAPASVQKSAKDADAAKPENAGDAKPESAPRKPMDVPALYID